MATQTFPLLDIADEDALHYSRLLTVEERPFARLASRLRAKNSLINTFPRQLPTPPADDPAEGDIMLDDDVLETAPQFDYKQQELDRRQWRQELLLEFTTLENTLTRIQLLTDSNERERQRYALQKTKILDTAQAVKSSTADLGVQLQDAQSTLALRKEYDVLADSITSNKALKPRDELHAAMESLNAEILDLQNESLEQQALWKERRTQFARVVDESRQMMRAIRGEKDSPAPDPPVDGDNDVTLDDPPRDDNDRASTEGEIDESGAVTPPARDVEFASSPAQPEPARAEDKLRDDGAETTGEQMDIT